MFSKIRNIFIAKELARNIYVDEISSVLKNRFNKTEKAFEEKSKPIISFVEKDISILRNLLHALSKKEVSSIYTNSLKNKFCERALSMLNIEIPNNSYQSVTDYITKLQSALAEMSSLGFKEIVHLHAFKDDMNRIAAQTKMVIERVETLRKIVKEYDTLKKMNDIENEVKMMMEYIKNKHGLESEIKGIEKDSIFFRKKLEKETENFENFLNDENFNKVRMLELEIAELKNEKAWIEQQLDSEFSSIERPMKKFMHFQKSRHSLLEGYIKNPKNAFLSDDGIVIYQVIEDIKNAIEKGDIEVEEKKYEKIVEILRNIDFLRSLKEQHKGVTAKIYDINEQIEKFRFLFEKKQEYEIEISRIKSRICELEKNTEKKIDEKNEITNKIEINRNKMEDMLSDLTGERISVKIK